MRFEHFLNQRSEREMFLCKICFLLICFWIAWESGGERAFERYFQNSSLEDTLQPTPFLGYFEAQELITKSSNLINFSQSDISQNTFTLKTQGKIEDFFALLNTLKTYPTLKITAFFLDSKGEFSLTLQGENTQTYAHTSSILSPSFSLKSPWSQEVVQNSPLLLEALLNQKAKINGRWIRIGEKISGYTLQAIQDNSVVLQNPNHTLTLHLRERIFK